MTISPRDEQKPRRRWVPLVFVFLALFLAVTTHSQPAMAQAGGETVFCPDCDAAIAAIGAIFTTLSNYIQIVLTWIEQQGFSAVAAAVSGSTAVQIKAMELVGNTTIAANMYTHQVQGAAQLQGNTAMSNQSTACAVTAYEQAIERLGQRDYLATAESFYETSSCKGVNADCQGPVRKQERYWDLCELGFFSQGQGGGGAQGEYGTLTSQCPAPYDQSYADRDENLEIFLNTPQMLLASPCIQPDGYPSFAPNATKCQGGTAVTAIIDNTDPTQSSRSWIAAYKLCENLDTDVSTPSYATARTTPNSSDIDSIMKDRGATTARIGGVKQACLHALFERTACPANVNAQAVGINESCHADQLAVCNILKGVPNPGALDYGGSQGAPVFPGNGSTGIGMGFSTDPALQHCDDNGLSLMMAKKIKAHPIADLGRSKVLAAQARDQHDMEAIHNSSDQYSQGYDAAIRQETADLQAMIANAMAAQAHGAGNAPSPATTGR